MSYNLRFLTPRDGINHWDHRKGLVVDLMKKEGADLIATQEGTSRTENVSVNSSGVPQQLADLEWMFHGEFAWFGVAREDDGETCAILYRKSRFEVLEQNTFWLSEHPTQVGSLSWNSSCVRICTYGLFKDLHNGSRFYLYNCHLDHMSALASVKLIIQQAVTRVRDETPIFWTGDFNAVPTENSIKYIGDAKKNKYTFTDTSRLSTREHRGPIYTFSGFKHLDKEHIDFIFLRDTSNKIKVMDHETIFTPIDEKLGTPPSDHFPVQILFTME
ncbi:hypothetical protein PROFUN_11885 [Planoprotostelium fungivorum]|uniref:Endonuclease/exonuclease/phosphatase domain-containing protein n=1 Tax=Planoprotostelium fungivorum TaxID=1890364 RepID=A0A2P6N920_9EUKA|nr:hypothetical protein PROFUN_11885 [Planoprotostelium fungivorum]